jgi:hypothetical protein
MAQLPVNFDANTVAPSAALEPIPAGWYKGNITASEMKPTSQNDGSYAQLEVTVLEGEYAGRKVFTNLNLQNKNQVAVEIAYRELSAICHAVGVMQVQDTQQLHSLPLEFKVGIETDKSGNYEPRNNIRGWRPIEGATTGAPAGAPAGNEAPAWANNAAAQPAATAPATPAVTAPPATPAPTLSGLDAAHADGWIAHPTSPGWHYKGQEVKSDADVAAMYPAAPVVTAPLVTAPPATPAAPAGNAPWQAPAATAPAATPAPTAAPAGAGAPPPWAQ